MPGAKIKPLRLGKPIPAARGSDYDIGTSPLELKCRLRVDRCQEAWAVPMEDDEDPLAKFGLDAIDLRWTMKDIASKRWLVLNQAHVVQLIDLGLVEMREDRPVLTIAGQNTAWEG